MITMDTTLDGFKKFNVQSVPLQDRNLIEASAGTGKTYSIAILVLRLVLENKIPINKILMVTFTKAAVAELEDRIRMFIRNAYRIANNDPSSQDPALITIVSRAIEKYGQNEILEILNESKLLLDETAVMTIHSFCQVTLNEFALETNQLFKSEMVQDLSLIQKDYVDAFWRKNITTLHPTLLENISDVDFSRKSIAKIIDKTLSGQRFLPYDAESDNIFTEEGELQMLQQVNNVEQRINECWKQLVNEVIQHREEVVAKCETNNYAQKSLSPLIDDPDQFLGKLNELREREYVLKIFGDWVEKLIQLDEIKSEKKLLAEKLTDQLYGVAIKRIRKGIKQYKEENGLLSFDDLISRLHRAIVSEGKPKLIEELRNKYKAVFIDEFQDTDKLQYEIFNTAFGSDTVVFYIGDPKQSIYAWRQADINTYFEAGREVDNRYGMNVNYRSSRAFVTSMNLFFHPTKDFDTFDFDNQIDGISYIPVEASPAGNELSFVHRRQSQAGITVFTCAKKEEIYETVAKQVLLLLTDGKNELKKGEERRQIYPSDIGILVRSNDQGLTVKKQLSKLGVPAVTIDTNKVLTTVEAEYIYYLLKAILDTNKYTVSRALLNPLTGFSTEDLKQINVDTVLLEFGKLRYVWETTGIYTALTKFLDDFHVRENLIHVHETRALTNVLQIIEILHKVQSSKNLSALELTNWLKMASEGMEVEGDEYEQRIESDEDAVEIVTIHKSKGLEYNIVFAPFLDMKVDFEKINDKNRTPLASFKSNNGEYLFAPPHRLDDQQQTQVLKEVAQENRRLIYVAVTRAVYKCYIIKNNSSYSKKSSLSPFINTILELPEEAVKHDIEFAEQPKIDTNTRYLPIQKNNMDMQPVLVAQNFFLRQKNWVKMSYTSLARKPEYILRESNSSGLLNYDHFIYKHLIKGSRAGNFLHHIFENIDFTNENTWETQIQVSLLRYLPKQQDVSSMIKQLINHVVTSTLKMNDGTFTLSNITKQRRLNELEFNFNVPAFQGWQLNQLSDEEAPFTIKNIDELEGIMNGKIDLVFQHDNKYYILDWKSNFLGDSLTHYEQDQLKRIMTENNYHLQYLIYTVAVKKYLQQRLSNFSYERDFGGVIYIFIRGARANQQHGIYTTKPSVKKIEKLERLLS